MSSDVIYHWTGHHSTAKVISFSSKAFGTVHFCLQGTQEQRRLRFNWWWFSSSTNNWCSGMTFCKIILNSVHWNAIQSTWRKKLAIICLLQTLQRSWQNCFLLCCYLLSSVTSYPYLFSGWRVEEGPLVKECPSKCVCRYAILASIYWRSYRRGIHLGHELVFTLLLTIY